jgi:hypothetical protein
MKRIHTKVRYINGGRMKKPNRELFNTNPELYIAELDQWQSEIVKEYNTVSYKGEIDYDCLGCDWDIAVYRYHSNEVQPKTCKCGKIIKPQYEMCYTCSTADYKKRHANIAKGEVIFE